MKNLYIPSAQPTPSVQPGTAAENPMRRFFKPLRRRMGRRAKFHDYTAPGYYLITATAVEGDFELRRLSKMPNVPAGMLKYPGMIEPELTPLGRRVEEEIKIFPHYHPAIEVCRYVIMPDHIHMVLHVKERLERMLGYHLAGLTGGCSCQLRELADSNDLRLFQPFHDLIIFNYPQLDRAIKYVDDNPRRLIFKQLYPNLFKCRLHVRIGEQEYGMMGNIFLLKAINLLPVRIHRRWSPQEFDEYEAKCMRAVEEGAILISPAIHPRERAIMNLAIQAGSSVIKLTYQPMTPRTKPSGQLFDLCTQGRLLVMAPWPSRDDKPEASDYSIFHNMNDLAADIAHQPVETRMQIINQYLD